MGTLHYSVKMKTHSVGIILFLIKQAFSNSCGSDGFQIFNDEPPSAIDFNLSHIKPNCTFKIETDWYSKIGLKIKPNGLTLPKDGEITISDASGEFTANDKPK